MAGAAGTRKTVIRMQFLDVTTEAGAVAVAVVVAIQTPARAQSTNEAEIIGFHQLCVLEF
jgi:hypothetical protein